MKTKFVRKLFLVSAYDMRAIEEYLEGMARAGLMFAKRKGMFFYFEKCEPKRVRFFVDVFAKASIFDTRPDPKTEEYIEYCMASGWKHLHTDGKLQFFCAESENAVPIQTDNALRLKLIHKNTLATNGVTWILLPIMFVMILVQSHLLNQLIPLGNSLVTQGLLMIVCLTQIIRYTVFYVHNKNRIKNNEALFFYSEKNVRRFHLANILLVLIIFALFLVTSLDLDSKMAFVIFVILIIAGISIALFNQMDRSFSRAHNILAISIISIVGIVFLNLAIGFLALGSIFLSPDSERISYFDPVSGASVTQFLSHDFIPVTLDQLGVVTAEIVITDTSASHDRSVFGTKDQYWETVYGENMTELACLDYTVVKSSFVPILEITRDGYLRMPAIGIFEDITEAEGNLWGAEKVYLATDDIGRETRLILFADKLLRIESESIPFTEDVVNVFLEELK